MPMTESAGRVITDDSRIEAIKKAHDSIGCPWCKSKMDCPTLMMLAEIKLLHVKMDNRLEKDPYGFC